MARTTPATRALDALGVAYELRTYDYESGPNIGARAAEALGVEPARMLKTLMVKVDGRPACVVTPSDADISLKKTAAAFEAKSAILMPAPEAQKTTGYVVGGISPLGQRKRSPVCLNARALSFERVFCNGGARGLQILLSSHDLVTATQAILAELDAGR